MVNKEGLEYYEVGGAPRDIIRGEEPKDYDYVVIGETPEEMEERGFLPVASAEFPVFLDKDNADEGELGDEYALARTERSEGRGYTGFDWETDEVSLEEDLRRRDFTINAMARNPETGEIIDPYGGQEDLEREIIRHVDEESFGDDPLRVIRMARFASRFDFEVHEETMRIAKSTAEEISELDNQRITREFLKAMKQADNPSKFFRICYEANVFDYYLPFVNKMAEIPAGPPKYHKEGSVLEHSLMVVDELYQIRGNNPRELLGAFLHDVGKIVTYDEDEPHKHYGHEKEGGEIIEYLRKTRDNMEYELYKHLKRACEDHMKVKRVPEMNNGKLIDLVSKYEGVSTVDVDFMVALAVADTRGRIPSDDIETDDIKEILDMTMEAMSRIDGEYLLDKHGEEFFEWEGEKKGQVVRSDYSEELNKIRKNEES